MAEYKVVPFTASVTNKEGSGAAATQLETLCNDLAGQGWEFVGLETVETIIGGSKGCFGFGATPPMMEKFSMAVFKR
jgi:hypothetical protein